MEATRMEHTEIPAQLWQIGVIHSPYRTAQEAPRQGRIRAMHSTIELFPRYLPGLRDVDLWSHLFILYWMDRADRTLLSATPPGTATSHGVFATRSPHRPNPIGIGIARLISRTESQLVVSGLDALDGTPVLDIKPYSPEIDCIPDATTGWMTGQISDDEGEEKSGHR
jgi:tRNA-Thr(GGU) m(6)t(6)A37 methyltransferase TsaA